MESVVIHPGSANTAATENPEADPSKTGTSSVRLTVSDRASSCQSLIGPAMIQWASPAGPRVVHVVTPVIKAALRQCRAMPFGIMVLRRRDLAAKVEDCLRRPGRNPRAFWIMLLLWRLVLSATRSLWQMSANKLVLTS